MLSELAPVWEVLMARKQEKTTLYLRGMPVNLVREAKAAAARRGSTLAAFVCDTLSRSLEREEPPPGEPPSEPITDPLEAAMAWYEENRARLLRRYGDEYVAIEDGAVIDHDRDFSALASRVFSALG